MSSQREDQRPSACLRAQPPCPPSTQTVRSAALIILAALLASCTSQSRPLVTPPPASSVRFDAALQPGCLLPAPSLLSQASAPGATLAVDIDVTGKVAAAALAGTTGSTALDAALEAAVLKCRFAPAYEVEPVTHARRELPERRSLSVSWQTPIAEYGPHRCLTPDYPHAARRAEEQGRIVAMFRKDAATGQVQTQLRSDSALLRTLRAHTLKAVTACLAHDEARSDMPADQWISILYEWRLQ